MVEWVLMTSLNWSLPGISSLDVEREALKSRNFETRGSEGTYYEGYLSVHRQGEYRCWLSKGWLEAACGAIQKWRQGTQVDGS